MPARIIFRFSIPKTNFCITLEQNGAGHETFDLHHGRDVRRERRAFLEEARKRFGERAGFVEVGKAFRAKYPPEYFKGQASPQHTRQEAVQLYLDLAAAELGKPQVEAVFVDGQPRSADQVEVCLNNFSHCSKFFLHLDAPPDVRRDRIKFRFPSAKFSQDSRRWDDLAAQLAWERIDNDRLAYYDTLVALLDHFYVPYIVNTNCPLDQWVEHAFHLIKVKTGFGNRSGTPMARPVIIDATNMIRRSIHATALADLKAGIQPTGGIYGALNSLVALLNLPEVRADMILCFFDCGYPKWRKELIPTYKQDRHEKNKLIPESEKEKVYSQLHYAREMFELLGVKCLAFKDCEADDGCAAASRLLTGRQPLVVSGDQDLYQCVCWGATVYDLNRRKFIDRDNFADEVGVKLEQFLLFRTLTGQTTDSVPGSPGCGEKRAIELCNALGARGYLGDAVEYVQVLGEKARTWQKAIVENAARLGDEMEGIDLSHSFGSTAPLERAIDLTWPEFRPREFLQYAAKLQFSSVLANPMRYLTPFKQVAHRRMTRCHSNVANSV